MPPLLLADGRLHASLTLLVDVPTCPPAAAPLAPTQTMTRPLHLAFVAIKARRWVAPFDASQPRFVVAIAEPMSSDLDLVVPSHAPRITEAGIFR